MSSTLIAALRQALAGGRVALDLGRIAGRCGYLDPASRTVVLNPDKSDEALERELVYELNRLSRIAEQDEDGADLTPADQPAELHLAHSASEPLEPGDTGTDQLGPLRIVG